MVIRITAGTDSVAHSSNRDQEPIAKIAEKSRRGREEYFLFLLFVGRLAENDLQYLFGEVTCRYAFHVGKHHHACEAVGSEQAVGAGALLAAAMADEADAIFGR